MAPIGVQAGLDERNKRNPVKDDFGHLAEYQPFLDHFIMLVFAKAAYDAGRHFGMSYEEIIVYGVAGFVLFGGMAPVAAQLADRYSRSLMMVVYHFGMVSQPFLPALRSRSGNLARPSA